MRNSTTKKATGQKDSHDVASFQTCVWCRRRRPMSDKRCSDSYTPLQCMQLHFISTFKEHHMVSAYVLDAIGCNS